MPPIKKRKKKRARKKKFETYDMTCSTCKARLKFTPQNEEDAQSFETCCEIECPICGELMDFTQ